jgi:hypothetical protein
LSLQCSALLVLCCSICSGLWLSVHAWHRQLLPFSVLCTWLHQPTAHLSACQPRFVPLMSASQAPCWRNPIHQHSVSIMNRVYSSRALGIKLCVLSKASAAAAPECCLWLWRTELFLSQQPNHVSLSAWRQLAAMIDMPASMCVVWCVCVCALVRASATSCMRSKYGCS